jgi:hypothetical protein
MVIITAAVLREEARCVCRQAAGMAATKKIEHLVGLYMSEQEGPVHHGHRVLSLREPRSK